MQQQRTCACRVAGDWQSGTATHLDMVSIVPHPFVLSLVAMRVLTPATAGRPWQAHPRPKRPDVVAATIGCMHVLISARGNGASGGIVLRLSQPTAGQTCRASPGPQGGKLECRRPWVDKWLQHMCREREADWLWGPPHLPGPSEVPRLAECISNFDQGSSPPSVPFPLQTFRLRAQKTRSMAQASTTLQDAALRDIRQH